MAQPILTSFSTLAALSASDFLAQPFIRSACASNPHTPQSILSFFFGVDLLSSEENPSINEQSKQALRDGIPLSTMESIWYGSSVDYDHACHDSFASTIRAIGTNTIVSQGDDEQEKNDILWNQSIDGLVAKMIACDQLARNSFRGTEEAFAYDPTAEAISIELSSYLLQNEDGSSCSSLQGELYPTYINFLALPMMHSETLSSHELGVQVLDYALDSSKSKIPESLFPKFENTKNFLLSHKAVLEQFGRYPHRNKSLGRTCTKEEVAWLESEHLPGWAKSQG